LVSGVAVSAIFSIICVVSPTTAIAAATTDVPTTTQLAQMRAEANAVQAELSAGAKKLDAARSQLKQLQQKAAGAKGAADKLDAKLVGLRVQISRLAGDLYERKDPDTITKILSGDDLARSLQATQLLAYAEAHRTEVLREVAVDTAQSKVLRAQADQNVAAAAKIQKSVTAQVASLQVKASKAATKLEAAQAAYEKEQARLAAERAAKAKAARAEAARAAAARRAVELANSLNASPAECTAAAGQSYPSGPWGGYSDGLIPASALCAILGGGSLRPDAAVAFNKMSQAYARTFGRSICITASYRPYADQVRLFRQEPSFAAVPGTSNHGWGLAVDLGCGVQNYGSAQYRWMTQHAGAYGWVHPSWAVHNPFEPWHWEFGHPGGSGGT
jgi:hypothetical protein